jgi:hypothetical protein
MLLLQACCWHASDYARASRHETTATADDHFYKDQRITLKKWITPAAEASRIHMAGNTLCYHLCAMGWLVSNASEPDSTLNLGPCSMNVQDQDVLLQDFEISRNIGQHA